MPAFPEPGRATNLLRQGPAAPLYEYGVAAVNGNGEGPRCTPIDTDPASWRNWDPRPGEPFRRRLTYNLWAFEGESETPPYYP